jgi:hypothetical protein
VYVWGLLVVDLRLFAEAGGMDLLVLGTFGSQFGLLAIWGLLANAPRWIRLISLALFALPISFVLIATWNSHDSERDLIRTVTMCIAGLLGQLAILRGAGYRIGVQSALEANQQSASPSHGWQFNLRDMFLWTAVVGCLLMGLRPGATQRRMEASTTRCR